ncbi:MAG: glucose-1-phosphate cytidylyltransferase [Rhodospirillaceae bacterium]
MKVVILAGGLGSRLSEETHVKPKPMVEIGGIPILIHIMNIYANYGFADFVICLGYKGYVIKEYFANLILHSSDVTFDLMSGETTFHRSYTRPWKVTLLDTGENTLTGGRLKRIASYLDPVEPFCLTYGDGVADINIRELVAFHRSHGRLATLTAVRPPGRFGALDMAGDVVTRFVEKPTGDNAGYINGGFFVLQPEVVNYVDGDATAWESTPLERLAAGDNLRAFRHEGFWQPMDTQRDRNHLEDLYTSGRASWKVWE